MKVFKFGGASVNSIERIKNVAAILKQHQQEPLLVIISAMGKTTNALEKVAAAFFSGNQQEALNLFDVVKQSHLNTAKYLLVTHYNKTLDQLVNYFTEAEWLLHDRPVRDYDYYYDQVVCIGELLSTCIVSAYLNEIGITNTLVDVRDVLRTDGNFRDAGVDWTETKKLTDELLAEHFQAPAKTVMQEQPELSYDNPTGSVQQAGYADLTSIRASAAHQATTNPQFSSIQQQPKNDHPSLIISQGFIGSTTDNESTTLGREGSDYSAAIFANLLEAESLTIWKDVEGVMSADPKEFKDAEFISELSYNEVIEMAYYGAQVIHPKTIKPLQNSKIPLYVKSFINPSQPGTLISSRRLKTLPPIKVLKEKQVLVYLHSSDFSFVGEQPISKLYSIFGKLHLMPNLLQTGAISIQICVDDHPEKIDQLAAMASEFFDVQLEKNLTLLTIRHYNNHLIGELTQDKEVVLMQKTTGTVQVLYK